MLSKSQSYLAYLAQLEKEKGLPSGLLKTQMMAESAGNPEAISPVGAVGAFQFMPATAKEYGIDPRDPIQAAQAAATMNRQMLDKYNGDLPSALAAYNWGQGNLDKNGLQSAPNETRDYINKIIGALNPISTAQASDTFDVEMPDGTIISDVPAGTTKEQVLAKYQGTLSQDNVNSRVAEKQQELAGNRQEIQTPKVSGLEALAYGVGQSIPGGDEASSALAALLEPAAAAIGGRETRSRDDILKGMRDATQASADTNPAAYYTGMIAPTVVGALASGGTSMPSSLAKLAGGAGKQGAMYGAAYGFGSGEGGLENRLENAGVGAVTGAIAGKVLQPIVNAGGSALSKIGKTYNQFRGKPIPVSRTASIPSATLAGSEKAALGGDLLPESSFIPTAEKGQLFTATAGQKTQIPDIQRLENSALAGTLTPKAQEAAQSVINTQNKEFNAFLGNMGKSGKDINAIMDDVAGVVQKNYAQAQANVRSAYDLANQGTGVKIGKQEIAQGLWKNIAQYRRDNSFDLSKEAMPSAVRVVQRLARYTKSPQGTNITAVKLGELENWRKIATTAANDSKIPSEQLFLRNVVRKYDDFMEQTAAQAVDRGDAAAITAFRTAVRERKDMGQLFERNKLVESIAKGEKGIDDVARELVGTGSIRGSRAMNQNLSALLKAAGKESDVVKRDLQSVFANRITERASTSTPNPLNPQEQLLSPLKLAKELEDLFVNQGEFASNLYGKEATAQARQAIKELRLIGGRQPKVGSSSGSGEEISRFLTPIIRRIPVVGNLVIDNIEKGAIAKQSASALEALSGTVPKEIVKQEAKKSFVPQAKFWSPQAEVSKTIGANIKEKPNE